MKLGMNSVIFGAVDLENALRYIALAGYENVELAAIVGMAEHVSPSTDAAPVRDLLAQNGLTATAIEAATQDRERLGGVLALAAKLGVGIVNIGSGGKTGDEASTREAIERVRDFARLAGDAGVTLAVKPHVGQAIYNAETGLRLMQEVGEAALGLNFDPSHLARADEDPSQVAPRWGEKIVTCHFRDCPVRVPGPPGTPQQQVPGRGALDLPAILRALHGTGYAGPVNLEIIGAHGFESAPAMALAAESRGYLRRCIQEIEEEKSC